MQIFRPDTNYDFVGKNRLFLLVCAAMAGLSIAAVPLLGLNLGIDFAGGYEIQVRFPKAVDDGDIAKLIEPLGLGEVRVQRFGAEADNEHLILVREHGTLPETDKPKLKADLEALAGGPDKLAEYQLAESGESLTVTFDAPVTEQQVRDTLGKYKLEVKSLTKGDREDRPAYSVHIVSLAEKVGAALRQGLSLAASDDIVKRVEFVGPQVGEQLRSQGVMAILYAILFILIYVVVRFDFFFGVGAIIALVHDVAIAMGVIALFGLEFNLQAIAALLTIIGYSINDTVVVYDRVRENLTRLRGRDLPSLINTSINQTLSRTVLTGSATFMVMGALLLMGGQTIRDFVLIMGVGILVGTYSSITVAAPLYLMAKARYGKGATKSSAVVAA